MAVGSEPDQQVEEFTFETNQVYAFDIVMSTGASSSPLSSITAMAGGVVMRKSQ